MVVQRFHSVTCIRTTDLANGFSPKIAIIPDGSPNALYIPPTIIGREPSTARFTPPDTRASRKCKPLFPNAADVPRDRNGSDELMSIMGAHAGRHPRDWDDPIAPNDRINRAGAWHHEDDYDDTRKDPEVCSITALSCWLRTSRPVARWNRSSRLRAASAPSGNPSCQCR